MSQNKKMLIDAQDPEELRVALVVDGKLEAFYVETASNEQTRGNIYKGVVVNVEPSLDAAFVDYGAGRHGFLQLDDLRSDALGEPPGGGDKRPKLKKGDQLLVQVAKEPIGNKGASLTTFLSIPGQYLVLTPGHEASGVSRQIADEKERTRLKQVLGELARPPYTGVIARTAAEGRSKKEVRANFAQLKRVWQDINRRAKNAKAPCLINKEEELAVRTVRDLFTSDVNEILVDEEQVYERVKHFIGLVSPRRKNDVRLHRGGKPIFHRYQVEQQIESIYHPTVRLPSGGEIVINRTEALVAVDVNSHKAHKGKEIEETAVAVNLEAAAEVARQLRLRDLGGLVVVDFIDMRDRKHRNQVRNKMKEELKKDKAKTDVGNISRFGLLELSRQRIRPPIDFGDTRPCPHCDGRGVLRTQQAVARTVLRNLGRHLGHDYRDGLRVRLHPEVASFLTNNKRALLVKLESSKQACLDIVADPELTLEEMALERISEPWTVPVVDCVTPRQAELQSMPLTALDDGELDEDEDDDDDEPAPEEKEKKRSSSRRRRRRKPPQQQAPQQPQQQAPQPPQQQAPEQPRQPRAEADQPNGNDQPDEKKPAPAKKRRRRSGAARRRARKAVQTTKEETAG